VHYLAGEGARAASAGQDENETGYEHYTAVVALSAAVTQQATEVATKERKALDKLKNIPDLRKIAVKYFLECVHSVTCPLQY